MARKLGIISILAVLALSFVGFFGCNTGENTKYRINVAEVQNGTISVSSKTAKANQKVTVTLTPNNGYKYKAGTLVYNDGKKDTVIDNFTFVMPKKEVVVIAQFEERLTGKHAITYGEMVNGTVEANRESADGGMNVTVTVMPDDGFKIVTGSLRYNGALIENGAFVMPDQAVVITVEFELVDKTIYQRIDKDGTFNPEGNYILFGNYPKTVKSEKVTISEDSFYKGFYYGSDGEKYAKYEANSPYGVNYTFSNGEKIVAHQSYYFKVEPIKWRIIKSIDGQLTLFCEDIIDSQVFNSKLSNQSIDGTTIYPNNWKYSTARKWLNDTFYGRAFHSEQQKLIKSSWLDNKTTAQGGIGNEFAVGIEPTDDNIYFLSYQDSLNPEYGFTIDGTSDVNKRKITTDYSRARGVSYFAGVGIGQGCGWWNLRSASKENKDYNSGISESGGVDGYGAAVNLLNHGVVPVLKIFIS